jgi:L-lactate dehydrogenase (cytochrome)
MNIDKLLNIKMLRAAAMRRLPAPMFHYVDGGADDEVSLRRNTTAYDQYELMPSQLRDTSKIDLSSKVLGCDVDLPIILSPTGMSRLFHHEKELAVVKAAEKFNTLYSLSTMATTSMEEVSSASNAPLMFQIYILKDRGLTTEFVQRAKSENYRALCLTVDTAVAGNRERDLIHGMTMPPRLALKSLWSYATHLHWGLNFLLRPDFKLANVVHRVDAIGKGSMSLIDYVNQQFDRTVSWDDVAWLRKQWDGPFVIKGLQSVDDIRQARDIGASAVMISNHGGRQLDSAPAPIDCIGAARDAIGDDLELILDGGIRRGIHVVKSLAAGANAVSIGRPYLYGLAAGGQQGVERALEILRSETERTMALSGCASISDIHSKMLIRRA